MESKRPIKITTSDEQYQPWKVKFKTYLERKGIVSEYEYMRNIYIYTCFTQKAFCKKKIQKQPVPYIM